MLSGYKLIRLQGGPRTLIHRPLVNSGEPCTLVYLFTESKFKNLRNLNNLPKPVLLRAILKPYGFQLLYDVTLFYIHILAKGIQRRIEIAQFHVDEAIQDHRVFW